MQFVIVTETRSSCKSDYKYVRSALEYFYCTYGNKMTPIYAKTKSELINKDNEIIKAITRYKGITKVIIVADYDSPQDTLNSLIVSYCDNHSYELVWMNKTIEEVFLNKIVNKEKGKEADNFLKKSDKLLCKLNNLNIQDPKAHSSSSNLQIIFDKFLKRK